MKPPKKRKPKARNDIQAPQTADTAREQLRATLAYGRSLTDFEPLMVAEQMLLQACRMGKIAVISEHRPEQATKENTVRAGFLRFLLLGGDARASIHERGVRLKGALIKGALNLENTVTTSSINCKSCMFTAPLILRRSTLPGGLFLQGSKVHGIKGDGLTTTGSVFLRNDFQAIGEIRLLDAKIGGTLDCTKGQFENKDGKTIITERAVIQGSVFFRDGFKSVGEVRLLGTHIGGDLSCRDAQFDGNGKRAISADGMCVSGGFIFRNLSSAVSSISLAGASVGNLLDDAAAWGKNLVLDGFTYGNLTGGAPTTASARLAWLDKQRPEMSGVLGVGTDFCPQPWKQLQKVLREIGHTEDARQVAIAFEERLRRADLIGLSPGHWRVWRKWFYRLIARGFHYGFGILTGYGYRPMHLLRWFFYVWLICAIFYWCAALQPNNVFAPSNPLVFQEAAYAACVPGSDAAKLERAKSADAVPARIKGAGNWYLCEKLREEYTGFSPLAYSLDVILPLVDLQQQKDWSPMIPTPKPSPWNEWRGSGWKHITRLVLWAETLFGWLASLLLVAIVSGLTKRRED